jgi:hypothetical protein
LKRFTETTKWGDPWFMDLPVKYKAFWFYICDQCDCAGIWETNMRLAVAQIGEAIELTEILRVFDKRLEQLPNGKLWIKGFIKFQYGDDLNPSNSAHAGVLKRLEINGVSHSPLIAPTKPLPRGCQAPKDKDKDKDSLRERPKIVDYSSLLKVAVQMKFADWVKCRTAQRNKPKDWSAMFTEQCHWLGQFSVPDQLEILSASIRGNWQGLFAPKTNGKNGTAPTKADYKRNYLPPAREPTEAEREKVKAIAAAEAKKFREQFQ